MLADYLPVYIVWYGQVAASPNTIFTITTKLSEVLNKYKKSPQYPFTDIEDTIITITVFYNYSILLYTTLFDSLYSKIYEYYL